MWVELLGRLTAEDDAAFESIYELAANAHHLLLSFLHDFALRNDLLVDELLELELIKCVGHIAEPLSVNVDPFIAVWQELHKVPVIHGVAD